MLVYKRCAFALYLRRSQTHQQLELKKNVGQHISQLHHQGVTNTDPLQVPRESKLQHNQGQPPAPNGECSIKRESPKQSKNGYLGLVLLLDQYALTRNTTLIHLPNPVWNPNVPTCREETNILWEHKEEFRHYVECWAVNTAGVTRC